MMKGLRLRTAGLPVSAAKPIWHGDALGVMFKQCDNTNAQVPAGKNVGAPPIGLVGSERHGTFGLPALTAKLFKPAKIESCCEVALKIFVFVSKGTESCASERKPSKPKKRKVLSFWMGKPIFPPNCWRFNEFFNGVAVASLEKGSPGDKAGCRAK